MNNGGTHSTHKAIFLAENGIDAMKTLRYIYNKRKNKHKDSSGSEFFSFVYWIPLSNIGIRLLRFFRVENWESIIENALFYGCNLDCVTQCYWKNKKLRYSFLNSKIPKLITLKRAIKKYEYSISIYCFPHQVPFLEKFFEKKVNLIQISLERVEELLEVDSCFDKQ